MQIDSKNLPQTKTLGNAGEELVANYLKNNGFKILARNFAMRGGEIDIIAQKKDLICFVEVKTRNTNYFALSEIITPSKQRKIISTAQHYAVEHSLHNRILRFDVALLIKNQSNFEIEFIENAFTTDSHIY